MRRYPFLILLGSLLIVAVASLFIGAANLTYSEVVTTLFDGGEHDFIVNQYRLPRLILAVLVGAGLGLSGAIVQGVIRNPLASPDLMGISAGAGLFATGLLVVMPDAPDSYLPLAAVSGGVFAALVIWFITRLSKPTPARLALIGISISAFLGSMIDFLLVVHPIEINTAMIWLTGSLWGRNWDQVPYIIVALTVLVPAAWWLAWKLNVMSLGEDNATSLGVSPKRVQVTALSVAVVLSSVSVSICGTISFVGLLAPHLSRLIVGHDHKRLLPCAAMVGGLLVLLSDVLARGIQPPVELPAGVLTSLIGAPYFIFLLRRYKGW
ncbi:iron chelate uptake ABC transporter family permease subunit [Vibrio tapetis subsp. quintayensis]|uniref:FecCD family ABC transporter permease n=1 Tax=Vibrio tapetis TaxID=52443 RepID=UPI0025B48750|nr:iron chelate uptake ABC transporter family permease subunit [Vibrio tapetis]MDN3681256.1 iron chelate uptake ABC transporter family permease subunit [Vibrio tapetis subsp. quintayensis]